MSASRFSALNQDLPSCDANSFMIKRVLRAAVAAGTRHTCSGSVIAVVLGNFVTPDHVVAKRLPRDLAEKPMILVLIGAMMGEHQVRIDCRLSASNSALTSAKCAGRSPSGKSQMRTSPRHELATKGPRALRFVASCRS